MTKKNGVQGLDLKSTGRGLTLTNHHFDLQKKTFTVCLIAS